LFARLYSCVINNVDNILLI